MSNVYVLDACAIIAMVTNENGAHIVRDVVNNIDDDGKIIKMHVLNLYEVYYYMIKKYDEQYALKIMEEIKMSPMQITTEINDNQFYTAGRLKSSYKMSLADSFGLAEAILNDGYFVTADHHEMDIVEANEKIKFIWIRNKKNGSPTNST